MRRTWYKYDCSRRFVILVSVMAIRLIVDFYILKCNKFCPGADLGGGGPGGPDPPFPI